MTKEEFLNKLSNPIDLDNNGKIAVCQHYIDNYPINMHGMFVKLNIPISGGSEESVNRAFTTLQGRINEFLKIK